MGGRGGSTKSNHLEQVEYSRAVAASHRRIVAHLEKEKREKEKQFLESRKKKAAKTVNAAIKESSKSTRKKTENVNATPKASKPRKAAAKTVNAAIKESSKSTRKKTENVNATPKASKPRKAAAAAKQLGIFDEEN